MKKAIIVLMCLFFAFSGCELDTTHADIESVGWILENIDSRFWVDGFNGARAFFSLDINLSGDVITSEDIKSVRVTDEEGTFWTFAGRDITMNEEGNFFALTRLFNTVIDDDGALMAAGDLTITITYSSDKSSTFIRKIPAPGSSTQGDAARIYAPEYYSPFSGSYAALPHQVDEDDTSGVIENEILTVEFSIDDDLFYSGWIWLYDENKNWIGYSDLFRSFEDKQIGSLINNGTALYRDGTPNEVVLDSGSINFDSTYGFSDIDTYVIVITDGQQYASLAGVSYDCRSITQYFEINSVY